jgi:hypothetical protein
MLGKGVYCPRGQQRLPSREAVFGRFAWQEVMASREHGILSFAHRRVSLSFSIHG